MKTGLLKNAVITIDNYKNKKIIIWRECKKLLCFPSDQQERVPAIEGN